MIEALLPAGLSPGVGLFLALASFVTSATTAAFGLGGGLGMLAVLSLYLPVAVLIPVHGLVQLGSNVGRVVVQRAHVDWPAVGPFFAGALFGAGIGARFVVALPEAVLQTALGLFILVLTFVKMPALGALTKRGFVLMGAGTTFLTMFFGATGPINAGILAQTYPDRQRLVGTMAATTAVQHALKGVAFFALGVGFGPYLPLTGAMIATGFLGTMAGTAFLKRLDETWFRRILMAILTVLGLDLLRRGVTGLLG
ncbi:MAG: sulfite exporter TauE/SafE family protein [Rhizobiaceae bacterium]|nr:sulfite exporter TauE/SafE family protein [Rhizobiaceae bacterium]